MRRARPPSVPPIARGVSPSPRGRFVLEQRDDGVCPVGNVVEALLIADGSEAGGHDIQFLPGERASGVGLGGRFRPADIGFGFSCPGEPGDRRVVPDEPNQLFHELVHPLASLGRERDDGSGQVLGVVVGHRHGPRSS